MDTDSLYTDLLRRHRAMLWGMCWHHARGNWDRCCDLLQEVSITLWEKRDRLRPGALPHEEREWVRWQARSVFYRSGRRHRPAMVPLDEALADTLVADDGSTTVETVDDLLAALGPDERRIVRLRLDGYRADEIGGILGLAPDAVYQRLHRAVVKMRRVALALLALFATASIAVAVVPQWREAVFGTSVEEAVPVEETIPATPADTVAAEMPPPPAPARPAPRERMEPMEHLESLEQPLDEPPLPVDDVPTVSLDGNSLTVSGVYGERVTVCTRSGTLLASQVCNGICTFTIFPDVNMLSISNRYGDIIVKIGDRPEVVLIQ